MKASKILIKIGLVLLIVMAAVLVVRAIFNYTEGRKLAQALAELKARGVPLMAKDLAVPCPDEDNAARLWKAAESLLTTEDMESKKILGAFGRYVGGNPLVDQSSKAALKRLAADNEGALKLITEAGLKPCFLLRDPSAPLFEMMTPALKMIHATQLLGFSALFMAEDGDVSSAIERIISGLRFTPMVAREGYLMPYLIAVADTRMLTYFLGEICHGRKVGDDILVGLIDGLDPGSWRERLANAIKGERVLFVEIGSLATRGARKEIEPLFGETSYLNDVLTWLVRPWVKIDVRKTLPRYSELEAQARLPYFKGRDFFRDLIQRSQNSPWYSFVSKFILVNFESTFLKEAQLEATLLASRTGLACRLHKSRTGQYPDSLEALVPAILEEIPVDPFTGKPLVYRREGEGFIVYSLGSNQKDDGGRSTYMITQLVMDKDDDWTWKEDK